MSTTYEVPSGLSYSRNHEWVRQKGKYAVIGVTDYVQKKLREILYVELPNINTKLTRGQHLATIESVGGSHEVRAPVSGKIVEVNARLIDSPELINEYPYEDGWICRMEVSDPTELEDLMQPDEYTRYIEELELEASETE
ncbi:MAG: glycine cleavage system protein GcvH [Thaumarchaeota archaeon]|nr:glycine cleavage system protein GcvH [Candidatus Calditenuaceae archaeon]MCX8203685.1 glycine cleavage system protein GcvH [Nitrososphaeria archaeon]MDW8042947.1 glycine cleavage system protein GcvH [Nitrososphaerota archaeon]